jgi:hypothetical protein
MRTEIPEFCASDRVAGAFVAAVESGELDLPLPGGGRTRERWAAFADIAGRDLSLAAAGLEHPQDLRPIHFSQRTSTTEVATFARLYPALRPGELLEGTQDVRYRDAWAMARPDSFQPTM